MPEEILAEKKITVPHEGNVDDDNFAEPSSVAKPQSAVKIFELVLLLLQPCLKPPATYGCPFDV